MNKKIIRVDCDNDMFVTLQASQTTIADYTGERQGEPVLAMVVEDAASEDENSLVVIFTSQQINGFVSKLREIQRRLNNKSV